MTIQMRLGQFAIVDREPVDRGPNAGAFHGKGPVQDRAELYVLAEANSHAGEVFAGHVVSTLGQTWRSLDMSLTGSLREIYRTADANVREWNAKSLDEHQIEIGLACLARRGGQAVVAVGGPAVAFHSSAEGCVAYFPDEEHAAPLGSGKVAPIITRISFEPGDRLLMISSAALGEVDPNLLADILRLEPERVLREIYHHVSRLRDVTVVLAVAEEVGDSSGSSFSVQISDLAGEAVIDATRAPEVTGPSLVAGEPAAAGEEDSRAAAARRELQGLESRSRERLSVPSEYVVAPTPLRRVSGEASAERLAAAGRAAAAGLRGTPESSTRSRSFSRGLVRAPVPPPPPSSDLPLAEDVAREVVARQSQRARTETETPFVPGGPAARTLVRPRDGAGGRMRGSGTLARSGHTLFHIPSWIIALAGVFALFALIGAFTLPDLLRDQEAGRYLTLMEQAEQHYTNALVMDDAAQRREALMNARSLFIEASNADGAGPDAAGRLALVEEAIAAMDAIVAPAAVEQAVSLTEFGSAPVTASHLALTGNTIYLLDGNGRQVIAIDRTTGEPRSVFSPTTDGIDTRPVSIAAGTDPALESVIVADVGQRLWSYASATGIRALDLPMPEGGTITDIATFGGNLYVLDATSAAVYRFLPSSNGFSQRETVLETPVLAAARRLLVTADEVITTDADGSLHWFSGEIAVDLSLAGIDQPLAGPEPVHAIGDTGEYAVADPANARVVVFRRDGSFARQYVAPQFEGIQGLLIAGEVSYVFSGGVLYTVTWNSE